MSNRIPRGPYPGSRKFQRVQLRRFDLGTAANDAVAPERREIPDGDGLGRRPR